MKPSHHAHAPALLSGFVALACWLPVQAQDQPRPAPAVASAAPSQEVRKYTPKASESLDSVIANTLADSPLKIELLRQAYVELNPSAFLPGKVPQLRKNAVLTVPNPEQLLKKFLPPTPREDTSQQPVLKSNSEERWRWVRYP